MRRGPRRKRTSPQLRIPGHSKNGKSGKGGKGGKGGNERRTKSRWFGPQLRTHLRGAARACPTLHN